jgi:gas vesicle protein
MIERTDGLSGGSGFVMGLITGATLGAAAAFLFARKSGWELRGDLADRVGDLGQTAREKWNDVAAATSSAVDKGREAYRQAVGVAQETVNDAIQSADRVQDAIKETAKRVS